VERARALAGENVYGTDEEDLATVTLRVLAALDVRSLASIEAGTGGAVLAILAAAEPEPVRFVGGLLLANDDDASQPPAADATLRVRLLPIDARGRSRVEVSLSGVATLDDVQTRVHGSGPQRQRRAAFAALDQVRRALRRDSY
jgi:nicotinamide mononucleotide (NMN) deamidase PncC